MLDSDDLAMLCSSRESGAAEQQSSSLGQAVLTAVCATGVCCAAADVEWNERSLLRVEGGYVPRFKLETAVMRVPVVPGCDPRTAYGDLVDRGERAMQCIRSLVQVSGGGSIRAVQ